MKLKVNSDDRTINLLLVLSIIFWCVYSCIYSVLKNRPDTALLSGYLSFIGETGLDVFLAGLTLRL